MKLEQILPAIREGKRVRRSKWRKGLYMQIDGTILWCKLGDRREVASLWQGDILADDWRILKDPKKFPRVGTKPMP